VTQRPNQPRYDAGIDDKYEPPASVTYKFALGTVVVLALLLAAALLTGGRL
jgi:hypothetical protein